MGKLAENAKAVIEKCLYLGKGDRVLIIADEEHMDAAHALEEAVEVAGAQPLIVNITRQSNTIIADPSKPIESPSHLIGAIKSSNHVLLTAADEIMFPLAHTMAYAWDAGISVIEVDDKMAEWELGVEEAKDVIERTEKLEKAITGGNQVRVTSPKGTDITFSIEGRKAFLAFPYRKTKVGPVPLWGEIAYAPVEGTGNGKIVADGHTTSVGKLQEPIIEVIRDGRCIEITGGIEAEKLQKLIANADENANVLAEFGLGTNHKAPQDRDLEKARLGTVHFALGDNLPYPGGKNHSNVHLDVIVRDARIEVDGQLIIEK